MKIAYKIVLSLIVLVVVFFAVYLIMNYQAIAKLLFQDKESSVPANQAADQLAEQVKLLPKITSTPPVTRVVPITPTPVSGQISNSQNQISAFKEQIKNQFLNDWLYYPRLGIKAPVDWYVEGAGNANKLMATGLVHVSGTSSPDLPGDTVIVGHSSYYAWAKGDYKSVFAPLIKAQNGDNIIIKRNGVAYFYTVTGSQEIQGKDGFAAKVGGDNKKTVNLMTCVPIGTTLRRLIVSADLMQQL